MVGEDQQPVTPGDPGELYVRTPTMMRGYWARPELNERAFFRVAGPGGVERVYHRTGDLVRERPDGSLDFLGRKDRQIKARGYRIELDEVEAAVVSHGAVDAGATFAVPDAEGSHRIHAAVTLRVGARVDAEALKEHAAASLPRYALPDEIEILDALPLTTTGKIDRRALRDRALAAHRAVLEAS